MVTYFENLNVKLYVLKTHVKFHVNQKLFTTQSINLFFMYNFDNKNSKFKELSDDIAIDISSF